MLRVLLVEDDENDAELVHAALDGDSPDVHITRVRQLREARERLAHNAYDVVLLDLSLPDAMGLEGVRRVREMAPGAPIVVLTGLVDDVASTRALRHGAQDFLQKGQVGSSELMKAIRYARERQHYADGAKLLSEVSAAVSVAVDVPGMFRAVIDTLSRGFADCCLVDGLDDVSWRDGADAITVSAPGASRLYAFLDDTPPSAADQARLERFDVPPSSALIVPFVVDGAERGALVLGRFDVMRAFGPADLTLAEEIARRAVSAFEHIGLRAARSDREGAEVASQLKDEFLATLSHELRTPLTAILGWTHMLLAGTLSPEKQTRALETIERNARSQILLIEDVLDVSRIITGKLRLTIDKVEVQHIVQAAVDTVMPGAMAKGVKLDIVLHPTAGTAQLDAERMQQVLWNLLANAVKFTPRGGVITVGVTRNDTFLEMLVTDDGQGISPDFLPHVFDRFRQADTSMTRSHSGLGLGLAIARHIVELHGGTIGVESGGADKGSTFFVRIPMDPPKEPTAPFAMPALLAGVLPVPPELVATPGKGLVGCRILVVDDEPDLLELLRLTLERCGAELFMATSPPEALEVLRTNPIDLLVSDIGLTGATGYDLIRAVRELPGPIATLPAVALTAYASGADRMKALQAGFDHHVSKPFEPAELIAVIETLDRRFRATPTPPKK